MGGKQNYTGPRADVRSMMMTVNVIVVCITVLSTVGIVASILSTPSMLQPSSDYLPIKQSTNNDLPASTILCNKDINEPAPLSLAPPINSREAPYGEYCETRPRGERETWNFHKKVISYALFLPSKDGPNMPLPRWLFQGMVANAASAKLYYPDWVIRIYVLNLNDTVIDGLLGISDRVEVVRCHNDTMLSKPYKKTDGIQPYARMMMPRFLAIDDPTVRVMISRDADSRFHIRELLAVNQWLSSDHVFHSMRDHPTSHPQAVLGGMWGVKKSWGRNMTELMGKILRDFPDTDMEGRSSYDQNFMNNYVWPLVKNDTLSHDDRIDRCQEHGTAACMEFPIGPQRTGFYIRYFVGASFKLDYQVNETQKCDLRCKLV